MADARTVAALRRFYSREQIEDAYQTALAAHLARQQEVTIESVSSDGGSTSARWTGKPEELMDACEEVLAGMDDADDGITTSALGTTHVDFSRRYIET